jgi:competence protein ComEC
VLSHPHPDHLIGLDTALAEFEVGEFWDSGQGEVEGAGPVYERLLARLRNRGVPVLRPAALCGKPRRFGGATVKLLGPCPRFRPEAGANDNSLVLHITFGERSVLLVGDAETHQEQRLLAAHSGALRADLLKVGHHGSRSSTSPAFLDQVRPAVATVSCGVRNRFGHPHARTLATLSRAGVHALRLDRVGSVLWQTDGRSASVRRFSAPH